MSYQDELSVKLVAKDEMSRQLRAVRTELKNTEREMAKARQEFQDTGSPEALAELRRLEKQYEELAKAQRKASAANAQYERDLKKLRDEAGLSQTAVAKLGRGIEKHAKTIQRAGLVMAGAMALMAKTSISAYADAEKSQMRLSTAYAKFPKLADANVTAMRELNDELMNRTGADNDALAAAQANLAMYDLTGRQIMALTPLLNDYAIATGQQLPDAASTLGKALMGNARAMKTIGVDYTATGDRGRDLTAIMEALEEKVGGVGDAFGQTTAGELAIARENFAELQETIGAGLAPALTSIVGIVKPMSDWFRGLSTPVQQAAMAVGALSAAVMIATPRLIAMKAAMTTAGIAGGSLRTGLSNVVGLLGTPWGIALAGATVVLGAFVKQASDAEGRVQALKDQIDATTGALSAAGLASQAKTLMETFPEGAWQQWEEYGITVQGVVDAIAAGGPTWDALHRQLRVLEGQSGINSIGFGSLADEANRMAGEVSDAKTAFQIGATAARLFGAEVDGAGDDAEITSVKISALTGAVNRLTRAAGRQQALATLRKSIKGALADPSKESAYQAIESFDAAFRTFKDGSKAQARFVRRNYADIKGVIAKSGLSDKLQQQLLDPLTAAKVEANRVLASLKQIDGTSVSVNITTTGNAPYNPIRRAVGGLVTGPGTGTSDSIPALLSNGEYVIRAAAVDRLGIDNLDRLNRADRTPFNALPPIVNAPTITIPAPAPGRDAPLVGHLEVHANQQVDVDLALMRLHRQQQRDARTRTAGTR